VSSALGRDAQRGWAYPFAHVCATDCTCGGRADAPGRAKHKAKLARRAARERSRLEGERLRKFLALIHNTMDRDVRYFRASLALHLYRRRPL
jgi:hypothetical protein